ncbi:LRR receptor-like serine/threonine-protein kinase FLS2, partial [Ananas comosus]
MAYSISMSLVHIIVFLWIQIKSASPSELSCNEFERSALLKLKQSFKDPLNALSSWKGFDCCSWKGVECGNYTDRIIGLNLSRKSLEGEINPSLLELKHIISLDLSLNDFNGTDIPDFIGSLANLRYLNLSNSNFVGSVPHHLGNLSRLQYLDLGSDESISISGLSNDDLSWVSRLSSLRYLDMRMINLRKATNWLHEVNELPSLSVLRLSSCNIYTIPQSILHLNLTYLTVFDLSSNNIRSTLPEWLFNMTNLNVLDLSRNFLSGPIPGTFQNMPFLKVLNLGHNSLSGYIPLSIDQLTSLEELYLNSNRLNGTLPQIIGQMSTLTILNVSSNLLTGIVTESHFANLSRLNILNLSFNNFSLQVSSNWTPPFRLDSIYMSSCRLGPRFPPWLITQKGYAKLDIGNAGVVDSLPTWFWSLTSEIVSLNLSLNQIKGSLPPSLHSISITFMDLSSNLFEGPLPRLHHGIQMLQLNDNSFEGTIPLDLGHDMPMLRCLQLSNNLFHGPSSVTFGLWLANNNLTGAIPDCWSNLGALEILDLGNNNLYGRIPESFGYMNSLVSLHLNNNDLFGELPLSLKNCTLLTLLDLSNNQLSGNIPTWIPNSLTNLIILRLRSNRFIGPVPPELSRLNSLQLLDISINKLSGTIPISFGNFTSMKKTKMKGTLLGEPWSGYEEHLMVCINGRQLRYTKTLSLVTSVDLSSNNLYGEIPSEITSLVGLLVLNLSKNGLSGEIPQNIGNMGWLESLDLSKNQLNGQIPPTLSNLTSLTHLNLSFNNLSGRIPLGFQLQTFTDPSIYEGNSGLCGPPLTEGCSQSSMNITSSNSGGDDGIGTLWLELSVIAGFVTGVVVVLSVLLLQRSWRLMFFVAVDKAFDWVHAKIGRSSKTSIIGDKKWTLYPFLYANMKTPIKIPNQCVQATASSYTTGSSIGPLAIDYCLVLRAIH